MGPRMRSINLVLLPNHNGILSVSGRLIMFSVCSAFIKSFRPLLFVLLDKAEKCVIKVNALLSANCSILSHHFSLVECKRNLHINITLSPHNQHI